MCTLRGKNFNGANFNSMCTFFFITLKKYPFERNKENTFNAMFQYISPHGLVRLALV